MKKKISYFLLKNKNVYPCRKIYQGDCICKDDYNGKTKQRTNTLA